MINTCPWGYPANTLTCPYCKYREECEQAKFLLQQAPPIVINGLFGVWRDGSVLVVENTSSKLFLNAAHLDNLISILQAAQQELAQPWEGA